ncbi:MAG: HD domain-containing phosphohydrolase [Alphaproteobacteria bacterium]
MTSTDFLESEDRAKRRRLEWRAIGAAILLLAAIAAGIVFVLRFGASEAERDLRTWQDRLNIVIESRLQSINEWIEAQYGTMDELAGNTALQLYMTELSLAGGDLGAVTDELAERTYLRNLLVATADRAGFTGPVGGPEIAANIAREGSAGIMLLDADGRLLVATPGMPDVQAAVSDMLSATPKGERGLIDLYGGLDGAATTGFMAPVYAVQADEGADSVIGYVVGVKLVAPELYPRLAQPGATEATAEAVLVRTEGSALRILSPTRDGSKPLERTIALDTPDLAEAYAIENPGGFAIKRDFRDVEVLVTSRTVSGAPWVLLYKIDREEALAGSDSRRRQLFIAFFLVIGVVAAALIAVWFHASSRRASESADKYRDLAQRFDRQQRFLSLVTDSQPSDIAVVDEKGEVRFGNRTLAEVVDLPAPDLVGKTLASLFGPIVGRRLDEFNRKALETGEPVKEVHQVGTEDEPRVIQSLHVPIGETTGAPRSVLLVNEDITEAVTEREKRTRIFKELINTLLSVVDRRDPYSAHHSVRVAEVSRAIAEEMGLDPVSIETVDIAGSLMNLGKMFVPAEVLTAERQLTPEERRQIYESVLTSADVLEGVSFEGPVVQTLRQMLEHVDGTGRPAGLKEEEILKTAQVCAVANAFVGMVSDRAYRRGMEFDAAIEQLLKDSGTRYNRGVVAALINRLDNRGGREQWAAFRAPPEPQNT